MSGSAWTNRCGMTKAEYMHAQAAGRENRPAAFLDRLRLDFIGRIRAHLMHGRDWRKADLTGWILTEKFDGVRLFWDRSRAWTRQGNEIALPTWFLDQIPRIVADGELWAGYGHRKVAVRAARTGDFPITIRFQIFDTWGGAPWVARTQALREALLERPQCNVSLVPHWIADSTAHARQQALGIICQGGEGIMAREPRSGYVSGRTKLLLKIKAKQVA